MLLDENGKFKSLDNLIQVFGIKQDVMFYNGLKSAIPRRWLSKISATHIRKIITNTPDVLLFLYDSIKELKDTCCKYFYQHMILKKKQPVISCFK